MNNHLRTCYSINLGILFLVGFALKSGVILLSTASGVDATFFGMAVQGFTVSMMDIILSLDNALIIVTVASGLPKELQNRATFIGMIMALGFRLFFLLIATFIMTLTPQTAIDSIAPGSIQFPAFIGNAKVFIWGGAIALLYLAVKHFFLHDEEDGHSAKTSFRDAIKVIGIADVSMSIDNIAGSVGITQNFWIIAFGVLISMAALYLLVRWQGLKDFVAARPNLKHSAYIIMTLIAAKMISEQIWEVHFGEVLPTVAYVLVACAGIALDSYRRRIIVKTHNDMLEELARVERLEKSQEALEYLRLHPWLLKDTPKWFLERHNLTA